VPGCARHHTHLHTRHREVPKALRSQKLNNSRKRGIMDPWKSQMHLMLVRQSMKNTIDGKNHYSSQTGQLAVLSNRRKLIKPLTFT
jgi:hypothetical protein